MAITLLTPRLTKNASTLPEFVTKQEIESTVGIDLAALLSQVDSLPTSDPHVVGKFWSNSGVVTVSAG